MDGGTGKRFHMDAVKHTLLLRQQSGCDEHELLFVIGVPRPSTRYWSEDLKIVGSTVHERMGSVTRGREGTHTC